MIVRFFPALLAVLTVCCSLHGMSRAAVISIDFGSEWIKVALVKPGVPMEIVLNKESKRKTAAVVSLRNNDRLFGEAALNTGVKYPKSAYKYILLLVGQKFDSPIVRKYREWFPFYDIRKDEEMGTVLFQHDESTVYSPEELIGMMLNNSRQLAEAYAGVPIRDVVITVPPFFNQAQRRAILRSAALVGLNTLQLMNNNAAAALNYGLFRQASFNTTPHYMMFYDMGATSTTASIVEYRKVQVKEGTLANVHPQLIVKGTGFSRLLGGLEMEIRLQQHLAKLFEAKKLTKGSVYDSPRAMAKLLKEAKRVKQVLSANVDHIAQIEGLLEDVDFRQKVTRAELEELCSDLFERVGDPVQQALQAADMTMDEIEAVVLVGGGTRVPKIQENLMKAVNKGELGKSLNTDEATALGAVYQGAGQTKLFRVKKFIVKEGVLYPIQVSFSRATQSSAGEEGVRTIKRTLFQRGGSYPAKKVLTFNRHNSDFSFQVFYGDLDFLSDKEKSFLGRLNISEVYLAGVASALEQHPQGEAKGIKAHFHMDESGLLNLTNVESVFEYPEGVEEQSTLSKIGSTISNFFGMGGDDSDKKAPSPDEGEEVSADGNETETRTGLEKEDETPQDTKETKEDGESDSSKSETDTKSVEEEESVSDDSDSIPDEGPSAEQGSKLDMENQEGEEEVADQEPGSENAEGEEEVKEKPSESEEVEKDTESDAATEGDKKSEGAGTSPSVDAGSNTTNATKTSGHSATNTTTGKKTKTEPKGSVVKINLTAEVTILDFPVPTDARIASSIEKLTLLQQIDDDKVANEQAKNSLESHIFETKDAMYSERVLNVSTEEQREVITTALNEAANWMEDDGYFASTKEYKDRLRALKRVSRAVFKRVSEAEKRPKLLANLASSLNISHDFLSRMRNLSSELQIFTEVEMNTLDTLINETEEWLVDKLTQQKLVPPHEEPAVMAYEIEEQAKRLDREIMYLLKKLRTHPPPNLKRMNKTNATTNGTKPENETASEEPLSEGEGGTTPSKEDEATPPPEEEEVEAPPTEETLELPGPGGDGTSEATDQTLDSRVPDVESSSTVSDSSDSDPNKPRQEL